MHQNTYGRFIDDGDAYEITDPRTPMPWTNVVSNGRYGFVVSQNGGGFSFVDHCQLNVLTRWDMDLIRDERGRFVYLADRDDASVWSLAPSPCKPAYDLYRCVHRPGSTRFTTEYAGIAAEWTLAAAPGETAEIWRVVVTNTSDRRRSLRISSSLEWCCGVAPDAKREFHRLFFTTELDRGRRAILATKNMWEATMGTPEDHWNREWPYIACHGVAGIDADRLLALGDLRAFLGRQADPARPEALLTPLPTIGKFGRFGDAAAMLGGDFELEAGESRTITFMIGQANTRRDALALVDRYASATAVELAIEQAEAEWRGRLAPTRVQTERSDFDLLNNTWLPYQTISARLWARTGYYQQSGAFGYRDQLQDSQIWLTREPERCAEQIMLHAAHQFADGSVYHWWNPLTETGQRSACSDDLLWLPLLTVAYLKETGDDGILSRTAPFVDDATGVTLLEHCLRAFANSFGRVGEHGLPLIGDMDWNDGLSALGTSGRGESVWLAMFLIGLLDDFASVLERVGRGELAGEYRSKRDGYRDAVNEHAWDGRWFRRATNAKGEWLGSSGNSAGQIFLNSQTWAILNDAASEDRLDAAWGAVRDRLLTDYGPLLLAPAYTEPDASIGYITRYAPGARENGGVYMHAAAWCLAAACKRRDLDAIEQIWNSISPPLRASDPESYHAEPYVLPGNVDGPLSDLPGQAGWTWYTGSAAWLNKVSMDWILGVRAEFDGLRIDPCPPRSLGKVELTRRWRGRDVRVRFDAADFEPDAAATLVVDGRVLESNVLVAEDLPSSGELVVEVRWHAGEGIPETEAAAQAAPVIERSGS